jgi:hypothetical protein
MCCSSANVITSNGSQICCSSPGLQYVQNQCCAPVNINGAYCCSGIANPITTIESNCCANNKWITEPVTNLKRCCPFVADDTTHQWRSNLTGSASCCPIANLNDVQDTCCSSAGYVSTLDTKCCNSTRAKGNGATKKCCANPTDLLINSTCCLVANANDVQDTCCNAAISGAGPWKTTTGNTCCPSARAIGGECCPVDRFNAGGVACCPVGQKYLSDGTF